MKEHYDVIIVGTGAAGLYCALNLPEKMKILLITKQEADQSDSFLAQGGICMLRGEDDYENYFEDTMRAGHYENNKRAVDLMIRSSNDIIRDLLRYHVDFARDGLGNLAFTREGAHSRPRILFHEDITGKEITQTLLTAAKIKENIEICEYMTMVDLISKDNTVCGIIAMDRNDQAFPVYSQYVVLACGGIGGLFKNSCGRWCGNCNETPCGNGKSGLYPDSSDNSLFKETRTAFPGFRISQRRRCSSV